MVGIGYDSHRFAPGRRLVLGGVEIEHERGLDGHSDADVLTHAVIDAILGAAGGGDIGTMFPDDDERWRDADSIDMLRTVVGTIGGSIVNVDATLICEQPRLGPHRAEMERTLADATSARVNVKATTQRGDGLDRPRRGHRLHRRGHAEERIVFRSMGILSSATSKLRASAADSLFEARVLREAGDPRPDAPRQGGAGSARPSCAGARLRRPGSPPRRSTTRTRSP